MYSLVQPPADPTPSADTGAQALVGLLLGQFTQGIFALDAADRIVAPLSPSLQSLFRRSDLIGRSFEELLQPVVPRRFLAVALAHLAAVRAAAAESLEVDARFANGNGTNDLLHYVFDFTPLQPGHSPGTLLVRVTDRTTTLLQAREIEDLHAQLRTQSDILQTLLRAGTERFAVVMRTTDTLLGSIDAILRRPAREEAAFRTKLEQTLNAVDRIGRTLASTSLGSLVGAAQRFESALLEMRDRAVLSGNDFLPLAVKLDELQVQFSLVRSLTRALDLRAAADGPSESATQGHPPGTALNRTVSPKFVVELLERNVGAPAGEAPRDPGGVPGTLAHTFARLTENVAAEQQRRVTLECTGLDLLPPEYQSTVKNIVIQFIRNAVMHGIEPPLERDAMRKPPVGQLKLDFRRLEDGSFELTFEDDGRGIDPESVREIAIAKALVTPAAAVTLGDRQALKMIFKSRYSTLPSVAGGKRHGAGLAFVRRYVHDAGGVISLGSDPGRSTRFKVTLPALAAAGGDPQVVPDDDREAAPG